MPELMELKDKLYQGPSAPRQRAIGTTDRWERKLRQTSLQKVLSEGILNREKFCTDEMRDESFFITEPTNAATKLKEFLPYLLQGCFSTYSRHKRKSAPFSTSHHFARDQHFSHETPGWRVSDHGGHPSYNDELDRP